MTQMPAVFTVVAAVLNSRANEGTDGLYRPAGSVHETAADLIKPTELPLVWMIEVYQFPFDYFKPDNESLYEEFKKEDAEVYSVSTDTAFVHKAWYDNSPAIGKIKFPMLADPTGKLCRELGTYIEDEGLALRGTFIVDPDGIVKAYEIHDNNIGRSGEEALRKLQAAKFVREHGGEVCPAKWKPGGDTLKPGLDLVGKL